MKLTEIKTNQNLWYCVSTRIRATITSQFDSLHPYIHKITHQANPIITTNVWTQVYFKILEQIHETIQ